MISILKLIKVFYITVLLISLLTKLFQVLVFNIYAQLKNINHYVLKKYCKFTQINYMKENIVQLIL